MHTAIIYNPAFTNAFVAGDVVPYSTTYVPGVAWDRVVVPFNVPRGSGVPFLLTANPAQPVTTADYAATVTLYDGTVVNFTVALGNMTVDEDTGDILVNPTFAQTAAWEGVAFLNLWQSTAAGDDNRTLLKQLRLNMYYAGSPAT